LESGLFKLSNEARGDATMKTTRHSFIVTTEALPGVSVAEVAHHIADASRLTAAGYHGTDPMSRLGPIEVLCSVPSAKL
jgi:hypothetical protein